MFGTGDSPGMFPFSRPGVGGELAPCTCVTVRTWSRWKISSHLSVIQPQHSSSWDSKGRRLGSCGHKTQADKRLCTFCSFLLGGGGVSDFAQIPINSPMLGVCLLAQHGVCGAEYELRKPHMQPLFSGGKMYGSTKI